MMPLPLPDFRLDDTPTGPTLSKFELNQLAQLYEIQALTQHKLDHLSSVEFLITLITEQLNQTDSINQSRREQLQQALADQRGQLEMKKKIKQELEGLERRIKQLTDRIPPSQMKQHMMQLSY